MIITSSYEIDDSYDYGIMFKRIYDQYIQHNCLILAIDLDDTIRPFKSESCAGTLNTVKRCQSILNCITIIYTANTDTEENIKFLTKNEIHYDSINDYPDNFPIQKFKDDFIVARESAGIIPKLYYNILLDDKSCGLETACDILNDLCDKIQKEKEERLKKMKNNMEGF